MALRAGDLDRLITILRSAPLDDGTAIVDGPPASVGNWWASKTDISDGERVRAAQNEQEITTRFVVRWDEVTSRITGKDFILFESLMYEVVGTKEVEGRHEGIEITANAQPQMALPSQ